MPVNSGIRKAYLCIDTDGDDIVMYRIAAFFAKISTTTNVVFAMSLKSEQFHHIWRNMHVIVGRKLQ